MSTGAECRFVEKEPNKWFYELQEYPYGDTQSYRTFGPFKTQSVAEKHLTKNHANPGGWMVQRYRELSEMRCPHCKASQFDCIPEALTYDVNEYGGGERTFTCANCGEAITAEVIVAEREISVTPVEEKAR